MANWCSNSVAFEGNESDLEQIKMEIRKMIMKEKSENCGQLLADDYKAHHGIDRTPSIRRYKLTKRADLN